MALPRLPISNMSLICQRSTIEHLFYGYVLGAVDTDGEIKYRQVFRNFRDRFNIDIDELNDQRCYWLVKKMTLENKELIRK